MNDERPTSSAEDLFVYTPEYIAQASHPIKRFDESKETISEVDCWTCRLRRKKCDKQLEGGFCRTCRRLDIDCLGCGSEPPEWIHDERAVEAYKADLKAHFARSGLIRGQPRNTAPAPSSHTRPAVGVPHDNGSSDSSHLGASIGPMPGQQPSAESVPPSIMDVSGKKT